MTNEMEVDCAVCIDEESTDTAIPLQCTHAYHSECVLDLILHNVGHHILVLCPQCRMEIIYSDMQKVYQIFYGVKKKLNEEENERRELLSKACLLAPDSDDEDIVEEEEEE